MWVELVVGSLPCSVRFSPLLQIPNQSETHGHKNSLMLGGLVSKLQFAVFEHCSVLAL